MVLGAVSIDRGRRIREVAWRWGSGGGIRSSRCGIVEVRRIPRRESGAGGMEIFILVRDEAHC